MTTINGTTGNDTITIPSASYGYQSAYTIYGGDGADRITVSASYVNTLYVYGGNGGDVIQTGAGGSNIVHGEGGNDTITVTYSTYSSSRWLYGDDGNDNITGSADTDYIYGGTGDDTIKGVSGADHLFGDDGNDTFIVKSTSDYVYYDGGSGTDTISVQDVGTGFTYNLLKIASLDSIEVIQDVDYRPTYIFGSGLDLRGLILKNIDGVEGDNAANVLKGGYAVNKDTNAVTTMLLKGGGGDDIIKGTDATTKTLDGVTISFNGVDNINGGTGNNDIYGLGGDDIISVKDGSDKIHFDINSGNDVVSDFLQGNDTIYIHSDTLFDLSDISIYDQEDDLIINIGENYMTLLGGHGIQMTADDILFTNSTISY